MIEIPIGGKEGKFAKVDDADYEWLSQYNWTINNGGYARRNIRIGKKGNKNIYKNTQMHRLILNAPDNVQIDHINGDKLDNRRSNLRIATQSQNMANRGKQSNNKSGYKGVRYKKDRKYYTAQIMVNYKQKYLGEYRTAQEAGIAYNHGALKYFSKFAVFNDIPGWINIIPEKRKAYERPMKNNTSGYTNVVYHKGNKKWQVNIRVNKKTIYLGNYDTAREGAIAYNKASIKYFGVNARLHPV